MNGMKIPFSESICSLNRIEPEIWFLLEAIAQLYICQSRNLKIFD